MTLGVLRAYSVTIERKWNAETHKEPPMSPTRRISPVLWAAAALLIALLIAGAHFAARPAEPVVANVLAPAAVAVPAAPIPAINAPSAKSVPTSAAIAVAVPEPEPAGF
jgi:hypothetical protein